MFSNSKTLVDISLRELKAKAAKNHHHLGEERHVLRGARFFLQPDAQVTGDLEPRLQLRENMPPVAAVCQEETLAKDL